MCLQQHGAGEHSKCASFEQLRPHHFHTPVRPGIDSKPDWVKRSAQAHLHRKRKRDAVWSLRGSTRKWTDQCLERRRRTGPALQRGAGEPSKMQAVRAIHIMKSVKIFGTAETPSVNMRWPRAEIKSSLSDMLSAALLP